MTRTPDEIKKGIAWDEVDKALQNVHLDSDDDADVQKPKTPEQIKKGLECCSSTANCADGCPYHVIVEGSFGCEEMGCEDGLLPDALALIQQLEAERDAMKEALGLMVYQYCVRGDKLDHLYMCAGETAFRVLGLEQYGDTRTLESWLFPECQDKEE